MKLTVRSAGMGLAMLLVAAATLAADAPGAKFTLTS